MATGKTAAEGNRKISNPTREARSIPTKFDILTAGTHTGDWYGIEPLNSPTFTSAKDADGDAIANATELNSLPQIVSPMGFTEIVLSSGSVAVYRRG